MVPRFAYFDTLATSILKNNTCDFSFIYRSKNNTTTCDKRYSIGVIYDLIDPDTLPWKLTLQKETTSSRVNRFKEHLNAVKHADYIERGNVSRITALSRKQISIIERDIVTEQFDCPYIYDANNANVVNNVNNANGNDVNRHHVAVRIHFADDTSIVRRMKPSESIYGIIQGIVVSRVRIGDILYMKDVDNWMHICFPNATPIIGHIKEKKVMVTFLSVGSTPMIRQNVVRLSSTATISACVEYIKRKLQLDDDSDGNTTNLQLYLDGNVSVHPQEALYNLCLNDNVPCRVTLYYSIGDAWN